MKVGVNCGSGQRPFISTPEVRWINVDSQEKWSPDIVCNALAIPLENESVDYFVLHHVLEHFGCNDGDGLIKEAHRLLKPGGKLLIFVPNMRALARRWIDGQISNYIFNVNAYGAFMGDEADRHRWSYVEESLKETLHNCAEWSTVGVERRIDIPGASIARDWWILGMECTK